MLTAALAALGLIFVAELGDKTLLTVLLLSTRGRAWPIFFGASSAFLVHTSLAVGAGQFLALLPHLWVRVATAVLFALFGLLLLLRPPEPVAEDEAAIASPSAAFTTAFAFIFLAEWGDMTQLLTATLAARAIARLGRVSGSLAVFAGATGGLWLGTALAVIVGSGLGRKLPERPVRLLAGILFLAFAALTALGKAV